MYKIEYADRAVRDLLDMRKSNQQAYKKICKLIPELREHPFTGTGKPEQLKGLDGVWSRRIDKKNRLCYKVEETIVTVYVISAIGHYDDK